MSEQPGSADLLATPLFPPLGAGRIGVVASRAGVGKTSSLVRIALGELVQGRGVLHVSLDDPVAHVRAAYDAKLDALAAQTPSQWTAERRLEVERRRVIHAYLGGTFTPDKLVDALAFHAEHVDFRPSTIVLDGFPFEGAAGPQVAALAEAAQGADAELWASALARREDPEDETTGLPAALAPVADQLHAVLCLEPEGKEILVHVLKEGARLERRPLPVKLDPATMLLVRD